jgi:GNAT superfamily N-acetyltransferase
MSWQLTHSMSDFLAGAEDYLRADPVGNTVPLTVLESIRHSGAAIYTDQPPVFGWHESTPGRADGAILQTPPFPVLGAGLPPGECDELARQLAAYHPAAANMTDADAARFSAAWARVTGGSTAVRTRMRLFRLAGLTPAAAPGAARLAGQADLGLVTAWHAEFAAETGTPVGRTIDERLRDGGVTLWEDRGRPVAMASLTRPVAGVCRVGSVYTPPEHRRHGYGGAVTSAVSQQALDAGAEVVLYTDLDNPTSNALYPRLGYRPAGDRTVIELR